MKKILGLDIGTNSIGGALIELPDETIKDYGTAGRILWMGSRIIPSDTKLLGKFETGQKLNSGSGTGATLTPAAERRQKRMIRRLKQRYVLRRTRLIRVMKVLGWLDKEFPEDFKTYFKTHEESSYRISDALPFSEATVREATKLLGIPYRQNKKRSTAQKTRVKVYDKLVVPEDWIVWYLRKKALSERITKSEFARTLYMMNQRRGFKSGRKDFKALGEENTQRQWVELVTIASVIEDTEYKPGKDRKKRYLLVGHGEESGRHYTWDAKRYKMPEWEGKQYTLLLTEKFDGKKWKFLTPQNPTADNWSLQMVSLDNQIEKADQHPGEFFLKKLAGDKNYKIRQQVVKRKRYQDELRAIWTKQKELWGNDPSPDNPQLGNSSKMEEVARTLYPTQSIFGGPKYKEIVSNDLYHAIADDIIYYQRDLNSQKESVPGCQYEKLEYKTPKGEPRKVGRKVAPISSPEFQEFRIWQDIHNLRVIDNDPTSKSEISIDAEEKEKLFEFFDSHASVTEDNILDIIGLLKRDKKGKIEEEQQYAINLFKNRKEVKGNETKEVFTKLFSKYEWKEGQAILDDPDNLEHLWHIAYSIPQFDKDSKSSNGRANALKRWKTNSVKNSRGEDLPALGEIPESVIYNDQRLCISTMPDFSDGYAALSSHAIRKLLPLMRAGKYWKWEDIDKATQERIDHVISAKFEHDTSTDTYVDKATGEIIEKQVWKYRKDNVKSHEDFQGLPTYMAAYVVYGRHSEKEQVAAYNAPEEIDVMKLVPNKAFNNPIVEKVIRETLCVVRDLWKVHGRPDEIHVELARELKKNAKEREKISKQNDKNRDEIQRVRSILREILNDPFLFNENPKPNPDSPADRDRFRLWKESAGVQADEEMESLFKNAAKKNEPSLSEIKRYILWIEQKCFSPYTGKPIPFSKLFNGDEYGIDHILPRRSIKMDGMDNLVVVEQFVNQHMKEGKLAASFIKEFRGQEKNGYRILPWDKYEERCKSVFRGPKLNNLLREDIPEDFISRQLNDTRHIARKVSEMLKPVTENHVTKKPNEIVYTTGSVTSELKSEWSLNEIWKEILRPRFERLERVLGLEGKLAFEQTDDKGRTSLILRHPSQLTDNPEEFELKRIDHRHHALDALIIACTTREHVRYLNSLAAVDNDEELRKVKFGLVKGNIRDFKLPWPDFCRDAKQHLEGIIVSFKQQKPPITKPSNKSYHWKQQVDGTWKKELREQRPNPDPILAKRWMAVRRSMFQQPMGVIRLKKIRKEKKILNAFKTELSYMAAQDTPAQRIASYIYDKVAREAIREIIFKTNGDIGAIEKHIKKHGLIHADGSKITEVRIADFEEFASKRVPLDSTFTEKKIEKLPYAAARKAENRKWPIADVLREHLTAYGGKSNEAFTGEGMESLQKKMNKPLTKLTFFQDTDAEKIGNAYIKTDDNPYFVIYENENNHSRSDKGFGMRAISIKTVADRRWKNLPLVDPHEGYKHIILKSDDVVYVPTEQEKTNPHLIDWNNHRQIAPRLYQVVKVTGNQCYFRRIDIANLILKYVAGKGELDSQNCLETTIAMRKDEAIVIIKNVAIKLHVDRIGNVKPA